MGNIKKNFVYQIMYQLLTVMLPLITSPYLSRVLGATGLGEYSYTYSIAYYFSLFILLGINNHGTRAVARVNKDKQKISEEFWSNYLIQLSMGIVIVILYLIYINVFSENRLLAQIQLIYLLSAILDINWFFFGLEKFRITVTRNFIIKILTFLAILFFVKGTGDIYIYAFIMSFGVLCGQLALIPFWLREVKKISIREISIRKNIKPLVILFVPVLAASIYKYMDKIMLGSMCSKSELGLYDNAEKVMSIPFSLITALGTVMLPRISSLVSADKKEEVLHFIDLSMTFSIALAAALAFGLAGISAEFAPWFWGDEFTDAGVLIKYISVTIIFLSWANVIRTQYLIPTENDKIFLKATMYGAVVNLAINCLLISRLGALGAVFGTISAEFTVAAYQTIMCRNKLPIKQYLLNSVPFIGIGMTMYLVIRAINIIFRNFSGVLILEILIGGTVYVLITFLYFTFIKKLTVKQLLEYIRR